MSRECVFCNITSKKSDTEILFENDNFVIIKDIRPAAQFHFLAIPKKHMRDARYLQLSDKPLLLEMEQELKNLLTSKEIPPENILLGFHWPPFISVQHLHMHALAPTNRMSFISRWVFKPINYWFRTTQYVIDNITSDRHEE